MFQIQYYKEAGILTTSLEDEVLGLSNMKQFIQSCSWGIWIQVVCPTVYTLHYDIIVSHWCKVWSPGEYIWPSVEANQSLWVWTFKVNSGLLAFAFSLWWTKCKLLFGKGSRKWSEWLQGFEHQIVLTKEQYNHWSVSVSESEHTWIWQQSDSQNMQSHFVVIMVPS